MSLWKKYQYPLLWGLVVFLAVFNSFVNLGQFEIETWDEARHALNAYEMMKNHEYIAMTYDGQLDYWNLKPPLGAWLIVIGYRLFGVNLWGLRFSSALSVVLTVIVTMSIARRFHKKIAITSGLILSTLYTFLAFHTGRYGDYDAQMALFMTLAVWGMMKWTENHRWGLFLSSLMVSLSFLLKSFSAVMPLTFILLVLLTEKRYKKLHVFDVLCSLFLMAFPVFLWAWARYQEDGLTFFQKMLGYDLLKRSAEAIEGHPSSNLHYLEPLFFKTLLWSLFLFFVIPFMGFGVSLKRKENEMVLHVKTSGFGPSFFWLWLLATLLFPLLVKTKSDWYLNPFYPALSVFIAWHFWNGKSTYAWVNRLMKHRLALLLWGAGITELILLAVVIFPSEWVFETKIRSFPSSQRILFSLWKNPEKPDKALLYFPAWVDQSERFLVKGMLGYDFVSEDHLLEALKKKEKVIFVGPRHHLEKTQTTYTLQTNSVLGEYQDWVAVSLSLP
ncbi:MAG: glycosyltransferase family 39 protein [Brevinematales bacterium]|nr:glycosyltransferase family 39 protein [Brevinematales bacterium]